MVTDFHGLPDLAGSQPVLAPLRYSRQGATLPSLGSRSRRSSLDPGAGSDIIDKPSLDHRHHGRVGRHSQLVLAGR